MQKEPEDYSLFVPEDINTRADLGFGLDKEGAVKGTVMALLGGAVLGCTYFLTHADMLTVLMVMIWVAFSYSGHSRTLFGGKRSMFKQISLMYRYQRGQKVYHYRHRKEGPQ